MPDERWDNDELRQLRQVRGADFEAVGVSSLQMHPDSGATVVGDDDDDDDDGGSEPFVCAADATTLCLNRGRFRVRLSWSDFDERTGLGQVVPYFADDSGLFWFFAADNWELLVKVLDGCGFNGRYWVFAAATTNVAYELEVADSLTGARRTYPNPLGRASPAIIDTGTFDVCP